jgi:hypothetical protein
MIAMDPMKAMYWFCGGWYLALVAACAQAAVLSTEDHHTHASGRLARHR